MKYYLHVLYEILFACFLLSLLLVTLGIFGQGRIGAGAFLLVCFFLIARYAYPAIMDERRQYDDSSYPKR